MNAGVRSQPVGCCLVGPVRQTQENGMKNCSFMRIRGFTMIELVVVIAVLSILAAFAIPRFAGLEREARTAATLGISGSIRSAATLAHSVWLAQSVNPVVIEGNVINLTQGYPDSTDIASTLADMTGFSVAVNATGDEAVFTRIGTSGGCEVVYNDALSGSAPNIGVDVSGC